jgi:hypothetical protein
MHIVRQRGWEIAERQVTPEHAVLNRRKRARRRNGDNRVAAPGRRGGAGQPGVQAGQGGDRREICHNLQQLLRVRPEQNIWLGRRRSSSGFWAMTGHGSASRCPTS